MLLHLQQKDSIGFKFQGTNEKFLKQIFFFIPQKYIQENENFPLEHMSSVQCFGDLSSPKLDFLIKTREKLKGVMGRESDRSPRIAKSNLIKHWLVQRKKLIKGSVPLWIHLLHKPRWFQQERLLME